MAKYFNNILIIQTLIKDINFEFFKYSEHCLHLQERRVSRAHKGKKGDFICLFLTDQTTV